MVHALHQAHRMLQRRGCVVDLHPTAEVPAVEVGTVRTGSVVTGDGPARHAAADNAIAVVIADGIFAADATTEFAFYTYADTIDELREYVEENWRDARIRDEVVARTRDALRATPGIRPRVREDVRATRLRPRGGLTVP
jgi:hypothetical protein